MKEQYNIIKADLCDRKTFATLIFPIAVLLISYIVNIIGTAYEIHHKVSLKNSALILTPGESKRIADIKKDMARVAKNPETSKKIGELQQKNGIITPSVKCAPSFTLANAGYRDISTQNPYVEILISNTANCSAYNFTEKALYIDPQFKFKPTIEEVPLANEIQKKSPFYYHNKLLIPSFTEKPLYLIFAIKYDDSPKTDKKTYTQVWYYKWTNTEVGDNKGLFNVATTLERDEMLSHYRDELKGYLK
ncbi:MAG: hypothetical protein ABSB79_15820 [Syntrophales bacterium]